MHNIRTKSNQYRSHKPHRPPTAQWHNTIGKPNPGGHREAGHCHSPQDTPPIVTRYSVCRVGAFRPVPLACDSISNRKATSASNSSTTDLFRYRSGTARRVMTAQHPAAGDANSCTATRSARCTGNWKPMACGAMAGSASTCATNRNPGKSKRHPTSAIGASPISTGRCVVRGWAAQCRLHPQQTREPLTREIDWRLRCGARVLVSTPRKTSAPRC